MIGLRSIHFGGFLFWLKAVLSGLIVAGAATVSQKSPKFGALLISLPLITVLTMSVMWLEKTETDKIAELSESTFWLIIPSMPMLLALPFLLRHGWTYWPALGVCILFTGMLYFMMRHFLT